MVSRFIFLIDEAEVFSANLNNQLQMCKKHMI